MLSPAPESLDRYSSSLIALEIDRRTQASLSPDLNLNKGFLNYKVKKGSEKNSRHIGLVRFHFILFFSKGDNSIIV